MKALIDQKIKGAGSIVLLTFLCTIILIPYTLPAGMPSGEAPVDLGRVCTPVSGGTSGKDQGSVFRLSHW